MREEPACRGGDPINAIGRQLADLLVCLLITISPTVSIAEISASSIEMDTLSAALCSVSAASVHLDCIAACIRITHCPALRQQMLTLATV